MKLEISRQIFEKKIHLSNFMKMNPMGTEFFHMDNWTDRYHEANSRVSQFHEHA